MKNITLINQILQQINRSIFHKAVEKYQTDKHSKGINSWTHLTAMLFCHISKSQSSKRNNPWVIVYLWQLKPFRYTRKNPKPFIIVVHKRTSRLENVP